MDEPGEEVTGALIVPRALTDCERPRGPGKQLDFTLLSLE